MPPSTTSISLRHARALAQPLARSCTLLPLPHSTSLGSHMGQLGMATSCPASSIRWLALATSATPIARSPSQRPASTSQMLQAQPSSLAGANLPAPDFGVSTFKTPRRPTHTAAAISPKPATAGHPPGVHFQLLPTPRKRCHFLRPHLPAHPQRPWPRKTTPDSTTSPTWRLSFVSCTPWPETLSSPPGFRPFEQVTKTHGPVSPTPLPSNTAPLRTLPSKATWPSPAKARNPPAHAQYTRPRTTY